MHLRKAILFGLVLVVLPFLLWISSKLFEDEQAILSENAVAATDAKPGSSIAEQSKSQTARISNYTNSTLTANHTSNTNAVYPL